MDAGAFSNPEVILAAKGLKFILVDCTERGQNADLLQKYGVRGFPTVLFCDPDGKKVGQLGSRTPADVAKQFKEHAKTAKPRLEWTNDLEKATVAAKMSNKPILLFVADPAKPATPIVEEFFADAKVVKSLPSFVLVKHTLKAEDPIRDRFELEGGPAIFVLSSTEKAPIAEMRKFKKADELAAVLAKVLENRASKEKSPKGEAP